MPDIVKCTACLGKGSKGFFICKSLCQPCAGTGEASKEQLLRSLRGMQLGDVDAAVVLHAVSAQRRNDKDIVLEAVRHFPKALQFASPLLKECQEILDAVAEAEQALRLAASARMYRNGSHVSTDPTSLRLSDLTEVGASDWGSFTVPQTEPRRSFDSAFGSPAGFLQAEPVEEEGVAFGCPTELSGEQADAVTERAVA